MEALQPSEIDSFDALLQGFDDVLPAPSVVNFLSTDLFLPAKDDSFELASSSETEAESPSQPSPSPSVAAEPDEPAPINNSDRKRPARAATKRKRGRAAKETPQPGKLPRPCLSKRRLRAPLSPSFRTAHFSSPSPCRLPHRQGPLRPLEPMHALRAPRLRVRHPEDRPARTADARAPARAREAAEEGGGAAPEAACHAADFGWLRPAVRFCGGGGGR